MVNKVNNERHDSCCAGHGGYTTRSVCSRTCSCAV